MNEDNFKMLMHFINERHRVFLKRKDGEAAPWTNDPILQEWRFCNVFRIYDKQSVELGRILRQHRPGFPPDILFNIFQFRAFNLSSTFEILEWRTSAHPFNLSEAIQRLEWLTDRKQRIFSPAYMIRGREGMPKTESVCLTLEEIWNKRHDLMAPISTSLISTLEATWNWLQEPHFWGWGPFTIYQVVLDLTMTPYLSGAMDMDTWTCLGPGGEKGFQLLFPGVSPASWPYELPKLLKRVNTSRQSHVPLLNLQDLEFCLCELQKYHRIANGGKGKEKYNGRA